MADESTEDTQDAQKPKLFDAPADVEAKNATGYAVYDTTSGRFRGPVKRDGKPTTDDVERALPQGHQHSIVRV